MASNKMYVLGVPTLKQMALIKATISLIELNCDIFENHIPDFIYEMIYCPRKIKFQVLLHETIDALKIPPTHKRLLLSFVEIVQLEIQKWLRFLKNHVFDFYDYTEIMPLFLNYINYIKWTPHGQIDEGKTARELLNINQELSISQRYKVACIFCLENEVEKNWKEFPPNIKLEYMIDYNLRESAGPEYYWTEMMSSSDRNVDKESQINSAISTNNFCALKYFWSVMSEEERSESVINILRALLLSDRDYAGFLCFILSQISERQLDEFLVSRTYFGTISNSIPVLNCLLNNWCYVEFFISTLERVGYSFFDFVEYKKFLEEAASRMKNFNGDEYNRIFVNLWQNASPEIKDDVIEKDLKGFYVQNFCELQDFQVIEIFYRDVNMADRRKNLSACLFWSKSDIHLDFFLDAVQELISTEHEEMSIFIKICADNAVKVCRNFYTYLINLTSDKIQFDFRHKCMELDRFLYFCFPFTENMTDFKRNLIFNHCIIFDLMKIILKTGENQFKIIDECLNWCELTENEIEDFKRNFIYECTYVIKYISKELFNNGKHELSDAILNWCLLTPEEMIKFKTKRLVNSSYFLEKMLKYVFDSNSFDERKTDHLNFCLNWCFSNQGECNRFKREFLYKNNFINFSYLGSFDNVLAFLHYCTYQSEKFKQAYIELEWVSDELFRINYDKLFTATLNFYYSKEEIERLKNELLLCYYGMSLCIDYTAHVYEYYLEKKDYKESIFTLNLISMDELQQCKYIERILLYIQLLNPSYETIVKFKQMIENEKLPGLLEDFKFLFLDFLSNLKYQ